MISVEVIEINRLWVFLLHIASLLEKIGLHITDVKHVLDKVWRKV